MMVGPRGVVARRPPTGAPWRARARCRRSPVAGKPGTCRAQRGLELRRGEILGICGVEGNGQAELIEVLSGLRRPHRGRVLLKGQDVTATGPNPRRRMGLSYIPEDRHGRGLVLPFSLTENVLLGNAEENHSARAAGSTTPAAGH